MNRNTCLYHGLLRRSHVRHPRIDALCEGEAPSTLSSVHSSSSPQNDQVMMISYQQYLPYRPGTIHNINQYITAVSHLPIKPLQSFNVAPHKPSSKTPKHERRATECLQFSTSHVKHPHLHKPLSVLPRAPSQNILRHPRLVPLLTQLASSNDMIPVTYHNWMKIRKR